jgi:PAS domain S-box-containing protein
MPFPLSENKMTRQELLAEIDRLRHLSALLKQSRIEDFLAVIEDSADGILVIDQAGKVLLSNPEAERILRRKKNVLTGSHFGIPLTGGERIESDIVTPDGDLVPVELWASETRWAGQPAIRVSLRDVTEKHRIETALRESEAKYRLITETSPDCIWLMAPDLTITYVNAAVEKMFGYPPEEYVGTGLADHCDDETLEGVSRTIESELGKPPGQSAVILELGLKHRDGHVVPVEVSATIVYDDQGRVQCFQGISRDITARKKAFEQQQLLAAMVRHSQDAIYSKQLDGTITSWNRGAEEMFGYNASEALGRRTDMLLPADRKQEEDRILSAIAAGDDIETFETERLTKAGQVVTVSLSVSPIVDETGRVIGASSICRDISKLRQAMDALEKSETLLNETGEMARIGGWEIDLETNRVIWTRTTRAIHEVPEEFEPDLASAIDFFSPEVRGDLEKAIQRLRQEGIPYDMELPFVTAKGRRLWTRAAGKADFLEGRCVRLFGTFQDITGMKELEEKRLKAEQQLRQAQKLESVGRLAGGIAHDFNNMLNVIIGYGQIISDRLTKEDPLRSYVDEIVTAGERSASLTRQILAFSRRQTLQPETVDLNALIKNLKKMLGRLIGEDIVLVFYPAADLAPVRVDPGQMEQVIMNLAVNARDAMPEGGNLTIETANVILDPQYADSHMGVDPGEYVMVAVSDTGVGMAPQVMEQIFEPFFTSKEPGKGTGLGLSTVYGIVKQSRGNIWVYSEPGQGTTFKIYLPVTSDTPAKKVSRKIHSIQGNGETILLVEDDPALRRLCKKILTAMNYRVHTAENGLAALDLVYREGLRPDLVLTDVIMPGMGGKAMVDRLNELGSGFRVIYMSGYTDNAIVHQGVLDTDITFIQKPFSRETLGKTIQKVLTND